MATSEIKNPTKTINIVSEITIADNEKNPDIFVATLTGRIINISYKGKQRARAEDEVLFTLPAKYAPKIASVYSTGYIGGKSIVANIKSNGQCNIFLINGATGSAVIYFAFSYAI